MEAAKTAKVKKTGRLGAEQRRTGYLFILPNCIIFMLFFVVPAVLGFYYSLTEFNGFGSPKFIGFANYAKLFADQDFYKILGHTFLYVLLTVPTVYVAALAVAIGLTRIWIRGRDIMRVSIFWPTMISTIIVGLIWRWIFGENSGIVNYLLTLLNGSGLPWLTNNALAMVTLVIATIWSKAGYFMIIIIGTRRFADCWWGCAEPISISTHNRDEKTRSGHISDIRFFNITCDSENGVFLSGSGENHIEDVLFENVRVTLRAKSKWKRGMYDLRPGIHRGIERIPSAGFYLRRADRVTLRDCSVCFAGEDMEGFGHAVFAEECTDVNLQSFQGRAARPDLEDILL